jgi:hypothetical protein
MFAGQDRGVTQENRSALENALDVFVYAPLGLALTAIEELPKLAEKGRAQVEGQITIARVVGKFAVAQGRRQLERRLGGDGRQPSGQTAATASTPGQTGNADRPASRATANGTSAGSRPAGSAPQTASRTAQDRLPETEGQAPEPELIDSDGGYERLSGRRDVADTGLGGTPDGGSDDLAGTGSLASGFGRPSPSADQLAIPGYDSLSASQVVQRLAGLSSEELEAVGAYESAHRARRTILTRVNQLKA